MTCHDFTPHGHDGADDARGRALAKIRNHQASVEFQPFPVDALPFGFRGFVDAGAHAIGCDPSAIAIPLLTAAGAAIGNSRVIALKNRWIEPAVVWSLVIAPSGSQKSPIFDYVLDPVHRQEEAVRRAFEMKQAQHEDSDAEGPPPTLRDRVLCSDVTIEALYDLLHRSPRGVLVHRDELSAWLKGMARYRDSGGSDAPQWLELHGARPLFVDRKTKGEQVHVPRAFACVTGGIQPRVLHDFFNAENIDSGFVARFWMAWPPQPPRRWSDDDVEDGVVEVVIDIFDRLYGLSMEETATGSRPVPLRFSSDALEEWKTFFNEHNAERESLDDDALASMWSKLEGGTARIALIHFLASRSSRQEASQENEIEVESVRAAITISNWLKHEAERIIETLRMDDEVSETLDLIEWISNRPGPVTASELRKGKRRFKETGEATTALKKLVAKDLGTWVERTPSTKGGRPTRAFVLDATLRLRNPKTSNRSIDSERRDDNEAGA